MNQVKWTRRSDDVHVEVVEDSLVVYDLTTDEVTCLDQRAAQVFQACTTVSADELAVATGMTPAQVDEYLQALAGHGLVTSDGSGVERRSLVRGAALAGAAAVGIWSMTAPVPAAASSPQDATNEN